MSDTNITGKAMRRVMTAHPERKPDALDLAENVMIAAHDLLRCAAELERDGLDLRANEAEARALTRAAANRVLAALDAYEAKT